MSQSPQPPPVIGIDLGTTFSAVAAWDWAASRPMILPNNLGNRTTPSVVAYTNDGDVLIGELAQRQAVMNCEGTIFNAKRFIGQHVSDLRRQDLASWPFRVVGDEDGRARVRVSYAGSTRMVAPEEVSALVLSHLKEAAQRAFNQTSGGGALTPGGWNTADPSAQEVTKAVVTVPAYFTEPQKRATRDAAELAGLELLGLLGEPVAAALAYGLDAKQRMDDRRAKLTGWHILVFDWGGGTLDVSILRLDGEGMFSTLSVTGDFHLGGEDFDTILTDYISNAVLESTPGLELTTRSKKKLRDECEALKRMLSSSTEMTLDTEVQGVEIAVEVTRRDFEELCHPLFVRAKAEVEEALQQAELSQDDIDDVVLVGGSTRIPRVSEMLSDMFPGRDVWKGINPDEAVAIGAAIQAAALWMAKAQLQQQQQPLPPPPPAESANAVGSSGMASSPAASHYRDIDGDTPSFSGGMPPPLRGMPPPPSTRAMLTAVTSGSNTTRGPVVAGISEAATRTGVEHHNSNSHRVGNLPVRHGTTLPPAMAGQSGSGVLLTHVTPFAFGIELADGTVDQLIPRSKPLPCSVQAFYTTSMENQRVVIFSVVECASTNGSRGRNGRGGENENGDGDDINEKKRRQIHRIGKFKLAVPKAPVGYPKIEVTFTIDVDGLLSVVARDLRTLKEAAITVDGSKNLSSSERELARERSKRQEHISRALVSLKETQRHVVQHMPPSQARDDIMARCAALLRRLHDPAVKEDTPALKSTLREVLSLKDAVPNLVAVDAT